MLAKIRELMLKVNTSYLAKGCFVFCGKIKDTVKHHLDFETTNEKICLAHLQKNRPLHSLVVLGQYEVEALAAYPKI